METAQQQELVSIHDPSMLFRGLQTPDWPSSTGIGRNTGWGDVGGAQLPLRNPAGCKGIREEHP